METSDRTQILLTEYEHINNWRIEYVKFLLQCVVVYTTISGFLFNYAVQSEMGDVNILFLGIFDIFAGFLGAVTLCSGWKITLKKGRRMKIVCEELDVYYDDSKAYSLVPLSLIVLYCFVVVVWVFIFIEKF